MIMKRFIILLVLSLSFVLVSCGTPKTEVNGSHPTEDAAEVTETEQPAGKPDTKQESDDVQSEPAHKTDRQKPGKTDKHTSDEQSDRAEKEDSSDTTKKPVKPEKPVKPSEEPGPDPAPDQKPGKHEHTYTSQKVPATCTKGGYTRHVCSCGESYISDKTEPLGHQYGSWKTTREPTYESQGKEQRTCSRCGKTQTRSIPKKTRPQLDFDKLFNYAIDYAVGTYGYEY